MKGHEIEMELTDILITNGLVIPVFRKLFSQYISQINVCIMSLFSTIHNNGTFTRLTDASFRKPRQVLKA